MMVEMLWLKGMRTRLSTNTCVDKYVAIVCNPFFLTIQKWFDVVKEALQLFPPEREELFEPGNYMCGR